MAHLEFVHAHFDFHLKVGDLLQKRDHGDDGAHDEGQRGRRADHDHLAHDGELTTTPFARLL